MLVGGLSSMLDRSVFLDRVAASKTKSAALQALLDRVESLGLPPAAQRRRAEQVADIVATCPNLNWKPYFSRRTGEALVHVFVQRRGRGTAPVGVDPVEQPELFVLTAAKLAKGDAVPFEVQEGKEIARIQREAAQTRSAERASREETLGSWIDLYLNSSDFIGRSSSYQADIRSYLPWFDHFLDVPINDLDRDAIYRIRATFEPHRKPSSINYAFKILSNVFRVVLRQRGVRDPMKNPARGLDSLAHVSTRQNVAWEIDHLKILLREGKWQIRAIAAIGYHTAMRKRDMILFQRSQIDKGEMRWVPHKQKRLSPPPYMTHKIGPDLQAVLDALPRSPHVDNLIWWSSDNIYDPDLIRSVPAKLEAMGLRLTKERLVAAVAILRNGRELTHEALAEQRGGGDRDLMMSVIEGTYSTAGKHSAYSVEGKSDGIGALLRREIKRLGLPNVVGARTHGLRVSAASHVADAEGATVWEVLDLLGDRSMDMALRYTRSREQSRHRNSAGKKLQHAFAALMAEPYDVPDDEEDAA